MMAWFWLSPMAQEANLYDFHVVTMEAALLVWTVFAFETGRARLGWLLDPARKQVHLYRSRARPQVLDNPEKLSGEPVLKRLVLDVRQVRAAMARRNASRESPPMRRHRFRCRTVSSSKP